MKKFLICFLIVCTIMTVQFFSQSFVSAKQVLEDNEGQFPIPKLVSLEQISKNQLQITYDRDVDIILGSKATNYWIQDTVDVQPKGEATLGKNDKANGGNSLNDNLVTIRSKDGSAKTFVLTLKKDIPIGAAYRLIICYVTVPGAPPYSGDNGMANFIGK